MELPAEPQDVWRKLFLSKYDDPRRAAAFLVPRTKIDWKQRFLDRDDLFLFLSQNKPLPKNEAYSDRSKWVFVDMIDYQYYKRPPLFEESEGLLTMVNK
jgi:hypothetical protein